MISPVAELKAVPVLVIVVCDPVVVERLILLLPAVTAQEVAAPPDEVSVIELLYPEGLYPPKYQTLFGPLIVGLTFVTFCGLYDFIGQVRPVSDAKL